MTIKNRLIWVHSILLLTQLFLAVLGLHCCTRAFSGCTALHWVCGLLMVVTSLAVEHGLQEHGLSHSAACGIFLDQGCSWYPLHCQVDP